MWVIWSVTYLLYFVNTLGQYRELDQYDSDSQPVLYLAAYPT